MVFLLNGIFFHYSILVVIWHSAAVQAIHHKLTKRELIHTFGVADKAHVPEYALITPLHDADDYGRILKLNFTAFDSTYEIHLTPNHKLVSPHVVTVIRDENSTTQHAGLPIGDTTCHYHGTVHSHNGVKAAVSKCSGQLMGVIVMDDHFLMLQTLPKRVRWDQPEEHLVYKRSAGLLDPLEHYSFNEEPIRVDLSQDADPDSIHGEFCDVSKSIDDNTIDTAPYASSAQDLTASMLNYSIPSEAKLDSLFIFPQHDPITLEIGLFLDSKLFEHFQREFSRDADQHLTEFALALINNVHVLYQQPTLSPNLDVVIVRFEMWKVQPAPLETSIHKNGQAQTLLDMFCRYQARINPGSDLSDPGHWDHGVLLTGYDVYHTTTSVAGVAPVARMCDELFACSLVEGLHLGRSFVLAHEMGHNMGMVHDGLQNQCGKGCCLMSAVNGAGKTTWSTCSVREFNAFLLQLDESGRGNCLRDPAVSIANYDHLGDGRLPGQRFTADQQCSYFWGRDFQVEIPNGRNMEDICRILWCGNSGSTISTAHPALEGSFCGNNKWCQEGRCHAWKQPTPQPGIIHGGWSEWTSSQAACPISPCQVTGAISIKPQLRTCTEPAPNNGGFPCEGANIRGIVCGDVSSRCSGLTREEFGDRLCTAIRNDPTRPDRQLTGKSFLHGTQPCKIWCHVAESELIRNKGQFPNGSPCGIGQYCVSGSCLSLACNDKAIVASRKDCPEVKTKVSIKWDQWSEWSSCAASCRSTEAEMPLQRRSRKCSAPSPECTGKIDETQVCSPIPPLCEPYTSWSEWSSCSAACGTGGTVSRTRDCLPGTLCSDEYLLETKSCPNPKPCPEWSTWQEWSDCSVACGTGQRSRQRSCPEEGLCDGEGSQITSCTGEVCAVLAVEEAWGEWLPCSVSCGIGFQLRERLCDGILCAENSKQARTCNIQDCSNTFRSSPAKLWAAWTTWSACSSTCGEGFQTRSRTCLTGNNCPVIEPKTQEKRCVLGPCPTWASWGDWSADCPTCSMLELRSRERKCRISFLAGFNGEQVASEQCNGQRVEIQNCDVICRENEVQKPLVTATTAPLTADFFKTGDSTKIAQYDPWQAWQSCSVSCGGGIRERTRKCPIGKDCSDNGLSFELEECNIDSCDAAKAGQWTPWTDWSPCSVACGTGKQFRHRKCKALFVFLCDGTSREERLCQAPPCSGMASTPTTLIVAHDDAAPKWSSWSTWSKCSCFTLTQFRRRFCAIRDPVIQGFCPGGIIDQRKCQPEDCVAQAGGWSDWSSWSSCSKDCGTTGHQIRNRMCSNPLPSNRGSYCTGYSFDQRPCVPSLPTCSGPPIAGGWTDWAPWSECSNPCDNGQMSRTRYCSNPKPANGGSQCLGSDFELKSCSEPEKCEQSSNGAWSSWTSWSECSATCGRAFRHRSRTCSSPAPSGNGTTCRGLAYMTSVCSTNSCPNAIDGRWSTWTDWTNCKGDCNGTGTRTRNRLCSTPSFGGNTCTGRSSESVPCTPDALLNDDSYCSSMRRHEQALESFFVTRPVQ